MKTTMLALCISAGLFSQNSNLNKMNVVKTNVTAYAFRNVNLTYERVINKTFSVNVGFGTMGKGSVPFSKTFVEDTELSDAEISMTNFTIEPRIYLGEGYGKGFYFAPYYRYSSFNIDQVKMAVDFSDGSSEDLLITGKATGNSAGLMLGVQWFLGAKENWVLDWWIVGAHYGSGKGDMRGNSPRTLTADEQAELKQQIEDLDIPLFEYTTTTDANGANLKLDGPWAGLRAGLSIGYRF